MEDVVRMWEKVSIFDICTALSNKCLQNYPYQSLYFVNSQRKSRINRFEDSQSLSGDEKARFCFRRETFWRKWTGRHSGSMAVLDFSAFSYLRIKLVPDEKHPYHAPVLVPPPGRLRFP